MKRIFLRTICVALILAMCFSLAACGSNEQAGGLGQLSMDDPVGSEDDDVGVLGGNDEPKTSDDTDPMPTEDRPEDKTPEPEPEPTPEPAQTEQYYSDGIKMTVPAGWTVYSYPYDDGSGKIRVVLFVVDPDDPGNHLFYASMFTSLFTSAKEKQYFIDCMSSYDSRLGSIYEWAPVLEELSAEEVIRNWGSLFSVMQADGSYDLTDGHFSNYALREVISAPESTTQGGLIVSETVCSVTIPGASGQYVLDYLCAFEEDPNAAAMGFHFYNSLNNTGICVSSEKYDSYYPLMLECMGSLDISEFNAKYN